ncbi:MAG: futalosine hydrolase [Planctomycetota bacterium]
MAGALEQIAGDGAVLVVVAAPAEARAVLAAWGRGEVAEEMEPWRPLTLASHLDLVLTGVGKANAAAGLARAFDADRHRAAISLGVAGMLPGSGLGLGQVVVGERSVYADEGGVTPEGFVDIAAMGFPPDLLVGVDASTARSADPSLVEVLRPLVDRSGDIATVSTCSGTDHWSFLVQERTAAIAEAMEGAALAFTAAQLRRADGATLPFAEVRVISNTTGDRDAQKWDLPKALAQVGEVGAAL